MITVDNVQFVNVPNAYIEGAYRRFEGEYSFEEVPWFVTTGLYEEPINLSSEWGKVTGKREFLAVYNPDSNSVRVYEEGY